VTSRVLPPGEVWIDDRLVVRESPIEGRGLFFSEDVRAGTTVIRLGGQLVSSPELDRLIAAAEADPAAPYVDTMTIYDDVHLVLPPDTVVHFGNHSCDPTMWHVGPYVIATRRDVTGGEEATIDYGTLSGADAFEMACRCGATTCRGRITSNDWQRADLQDRYRTHWVPELQRRISAQSASVLLRRVGGTVAESPGG
jgi:uncharacterized protein